MAYVDPANVLSPKNAVTPIELEGSILSRYREMAQDEEHEAEAREWSEGLIGDATSQEG